MIVTTIDRPIVPLLLHMVAAVHHDIRPKEIEMKLIFRLAAAAVAHASSNFCKGSFCDEARDNPEK